MFLSQNINVIVYRIQPQEINMNANKSNNEEKTDHTMNPKKQKRDSIMDLVIQHHFKELKKWRRQNLSMQERGIFKQKNFKTSRH